MSVENEDEVNEQQEAVTELSPKVSRARNRTVMLSPEVTGQVRKAIREEKKEEPGNFLRPGQKVEEPKLEPQGSGSESSPQSNLGLKFGKSVNRSKTTKLTREELEQAVKGVETQKEEISQVLPTPVVPKAFDPLTSIAPPNYGQGRVSSDLGVPKPSPSRVSSQQNYSSPTQAQMPQSNYVAPAMSQPPLSQQSGPRPVLQQPVAQSLSQQGSLQQMVPSQVAPPQVTAKAQASKGTTKIIGFLVSFDQDPNGEVFEIRAGRKLITSRPTDHGEYLLIEHETISPLHAILRTTKEGKLQVLDQLSEHGTAVTRAGEDEEIEVAGGLELVQNGDMLRFGERRFLVCLLPAK